MSQSDAPTNHGGRASLIISIGALIVSALSFGYPILTQHSDRSAAVEEYLNSLVGVGSRSAYVAQGRASEGSQASEYASTIGLLWEAVENSVEDTSHIHHGTVSSDWGSGEYKVCFPSISVLPSTCSVFANFEFTETGRISRFTIDGEPVEHLFQSTRYDETLTTEGTEQQIRVYSAGKLWDSSGDAKTLILWVDRGSVRQDYHGDLTVSGITAEDGNDKNNELTILGSYAPKKISYWDAYYIAVRVPDSARFLWLCLDGAPQEHPCEPIHGIR